MFSSLITVLVALLLLLVAVVAVPYGLARGFVAASNGSSKAWRGWRVVRIGAGVALGALLCLYLWELAYPPDENAMYIGHFVEVAQRPLPATARIVYKDTNIMNIGGSSWVRSRFELAPKDYAALLAAIRSDPSLKPTAGLAGHFTRPREEGIGYERAMAFLEDGKTIEVEMSN